MIFCASPVEAFILLLLDKNYEIVSIYLLKSMPRYLLLVSLLAFTIVCFTSLACLLINTESYPGSKLYYENFGTSLWSMLMMLNASDWPSPMIPLYDKTQSFMLFFVIYIIITNWGVLNLVVTFVYLRFLEQRNTISNAKQAVRLSNLNNAYDILEANCNNKDDISYEVVSNILDIIYYDYINIIAKPTYEERMELVKLLDASKLNHICRQDFLRIDEMCSVSSLNQLRKNTVGRSNSVRSQNDSTSIHLATICKIVDNFKFDLFMDTCIFALGLAFVCSISPPNEIIIFFFVLCVIEMFTKIVVTGFRHYWYSNKHFVNGIITVFLIFAFLFIVTTDATSKNYNNSPTIRATAILRVTLYIKNLFFIPLPTITIYRRRIQSAIKNVLNYSGDFVTLTCIMLIFIYIFASIGCLLFGGVIRKDGHNAELIDSSLYGENNYWPLNFNDMPSGMVTMFVLLSVNNMHVTASGFVAVLGKSSQIFFALWYVFGCLFLLNTIIAFVIGQFLYSISYNVKSDNESSNSGENVVRINSCEEKDSPSSLSIALISGNNNSINDDHLYKATSMCSRILLYFQSKTLVSSREESIVDSRLSRNSEAEIKFRDKLIKEHVDDQILPHETAAIFIQFAREGIYRSLYPSTRQSLQYLKRRNKLTVLFRIASWLLLIERIFVRPIWTYSSSDWKVTSVFPQFEICYLTITGDAIIQIVLLCVILNGLVIEYLYSIEAIYWKRDTSSTDDHGSSRRTHQSISSIILKCLLGLCIYQIILQLISIAIDHTNGDKVSLVYTTWISSAFSIIYIFWFDRKLYKKLKVLVQVIPYTIVLLAVLICLIIVFAAYGPYIFFLNQEDDDYNINGYYYRSDDSTNPNSYFDTYAESLWSVFVAITSSSYPNQVMPGYRAHREFFFYFFVFIAVGSFGFLNFILINVLVGFNDAIKKMDHDKSQARKVLLYHAFNCLDRDKIGFITKEQILLLFNELFSNYTDFIKDGVPSDSKREILYEIMDIDNDDKISLLDFEFILAVMKLRLKSKAPKTFIQLYFPSLLQNQVFMKCCEEVKSFKFNVIFDSIIAIVIIAELSSVKDVYIRTTYSITFWNFLLALLLLELVMKLFVYGWKAYIITTRNRIDFVCTLLFFVSVVAATSTFKYKKSVDFDGYTVPIHCLEIIRILILPRNLLYMVNKNESRNYGKMLRRILRESYTMAVIFSCSIYLFSTIGMLMYGGKICKHQDTDHYCKYGELKDSLYGLSNFYSLNFNDYLSAFTTLFICLHVSDFDVVTTGFSSVTSKGSARLFFAIFYCFGVLILLNILKSIFLRGFSTKLYNLNQKSGSDENEPASDLNTKFTCSVNTSTGKQYYLTSEYVKVLNPTSFELLSERIRYLSNKSGGNVSNKL